MALIEYDEYKQRLRDLGPELEKLTAALDKCMFTEKALTVTGRDTGCTCTEFGDYVMRTIETL